MGGPLEHFLVKFLEFLKVPTGRFGPEGDARAERVLLCTESSTPLRIVGGGIGVFDDLLLAIDLDGITKEIGTKVPVEREPHRNANRVAKEPAGQRMNRDEREWVPRLRHNRGCSARRLVIDFVVRFVIRTCRNRRA